MLAHDQEQQHQHQRPQQQQQQQPQPPDAPSPRPPPRPRKGKHAPKKQPQRGLGVAQLEKLRLEEQSKQEAACLASLQSGHQGGLSHLSEVLGAMVERQQASSSLCISQCLARQMKGGATGGVHGMNLAAGGNIQLCTASQEKSTFPLLSDFVCREPPGVGVDLSSCNKMNCVNAPNPYVPLASMASPNLRRLQSLPLSMSTVKENGPCLSQGHDLCSPSGSVISLSEHSITKPSPQADKGKRYITNDTSVKLPNVRLDCYSNLLPNSALIGQVQVAEAVRQIQDSERKMDVVWGKTTESAGLFPIILASTEAIGQVTDGVQKSSAVQTRGNLLATSELRLLDPSLVPPDTSNPTRNRMELPVVSIASTGAQSMELSSFQSFPVNQTWCSGDQISSRKRSWVSTQESSKKSDSLKGVDLNSSVGDYDPLPNDEISPATSLAAGNGSSSIPSIHREALSNSSVPSLKMGSFSMASPESSESLLTISTNAHFDSASGGIWSKMYSNASLPKKNCFSTSSGGSQFLSIRKGSIYHDASAKLEAGISSDFLTLGPSSSLAGMHDQGMLEIDGHSHCFPNCVANRGKDGFHMMNEDGKYTEQRKSGETGGRLMSVVSNASSRDLLMDIDENADYEQYGLPLQLNVGLSSFVSCSKLQGNIAQQLKGNPGSAEEDSLDLELRLSL